MTDWNAYNLKGLRAAVKDSVSAHDKLPATIKDLILAEIDGLPAEAIGVCVNAFGVSHGPVRNIQITIAGIHL